MRQAGSANMEATASSNVSAMNGSGGASAATTRIWPVRFDSR